jgi:hypothetical protein
MAAVLCFAGEEEEPTLGSLLVQIDRNLDTLYWFLGSYPPSFSDKREKKAVMDKFFLVENELAMVDSFFPGNTGIKCRLGDFYQMGYNLNLRNSWARAEANFRMALRMDSVCYRAHLGLGHLYATTGLQYGMAAEKELLYVLASPDSGLLMRAYADLAALSYDRKDLPKAKIYLEKYFDLSQDSMSLKLIDAIDVLINKKK